MPEFTASSYINAPVDRVWGFHELPDALERLTPASPPITVLKRTGGIQVGAEVVVRVGILGPIGVEWHALHTVYNKPFLFVDEQQKGPFAYWHHEHRFEAKDQGTVLTDAITFRLPGGGIVDFFVAPLVRMQLRELFRYRHAITKKSCE